MEKAPIRAYSYVLRKEERSNASEIDVPYYNSTLRWSEREREKKRTKSQNELLTLPYTSTVVRRSELKY